MSKILVTLFFVAVLSGRVFPQNLVYNPSFDPIVYVCDSTTFYFENFIDSIFSGSVWDITLPYYSYNNGRSAIRWHDKNCLYDNDVNNPILGTNYLPPRTGDTYIGYWQKIWIVPHPWINFNFNVCGRLIQPLQKGEDYCMGLYLAPSKGSAKTSDRFRMIVAPDSVHNIVNSPGEMDTSLTYFLKKYPNIMLPNGQFLTSYQSWTQLSGWITSQGNEKYFYLGHFDSPWQFNTQTMPPPYYVAQGPGSVQYVDSNSAFFYIDDAFVYARRPVFVKEGKLFELCEEEPFQPFTVHSDQAPEFIWYRAENPAQVLATRDSLYITSPGTYVVKGDACGYISYDTVTVRMKPCNVPPPNELLIPNILTPGADGINDVFFIQNLPPNTSVEFYNRWGNLLYKSENYLNDFSCSNCSGGVYFYIVKTAEGKLYKGQFTVVR